MSNSNKKFDKKQCFPGKNDILNNKEECINIKNNCNKKVYIEDGNYFYCRNYKPMLNKNSCHYLSTTFKKQGLCTNQDTIQQVLKNIELKDKEVDSLIKNTQDVVDVERDLEKRITALKPKQPSDAELERRITALKSKPLPSDAELHRRITALKKETKKRGGKLKKKSKKNYKKSKFTKKLNKKSKKINKKSKKNKGGTTIPTSHNVIPSDDLVKVLEKENIKMNDELIWINNNSDNENMHYEWRVKVKPLEANSNIKAIGRPQYKFYNNTNSMWSYNLPLGFPLPQEGIDIPYWSRVNSRISLVNFR